MADFRADRARFFEIVGSGSSGSAGPGLAIFSASSANSNFTPGHTDSAIFSGVGKDVFLFVSGNINKRGTEGASVSLFGGDLVVSGTLYADRQVIEVDESVTGSLSVSGSLFVSSSALVSNMLKVEKHPSISGATISGSIHHTHGGLSYIVAGAGMTVESGSNGQITLTGGGSSEWTRASGPNRVYPNTVASTHVLVGDTTIAAAKTILAADGASTFNEQGAAVDFRVETDARENALLVKGASNQVLIMSGGSILSTHEAGGSDVLFYVSGTVGSAGTPVRGASLFGGDVSVSGSLKVFNTSASGGTISGSIHHTEDGNSYLIAGTNISVISQSNGQVTINSLAQSEWFDEGTLLRPFDSSGVENVGIGSTGTNLANYPAAIHATTGDIVSNRFVTASLGFSGSLTRLTDGTSYLKAGPGISLASSSNGSVTITGTATSAEWYDEGDILRPNDGAGENAGVGSTGTAFTSYSAVMFGASGDIVSKGFVTASMGFSGSLTRLSNNTSYLVAGPNVTISSASNGQVTIESSAGSSEWARASGPARVYPLSSAATHVLVGGTTISASDTFLLSDGAATFNNQGAPVDFRVASNTKPNAIVVSGSKDQVLILSGGAATTPDESAYPDMAFFVSGAIGSKDTAVRGSALFGGDVVISGTLYGGSPLNVGGGAHFNAASSANADFRVESDSNQYMFFVDSSTNRISIGKTGASPSTLVHIKDDSPEIQVQRNLNGQDSVISFAGSGGVRGSMTGLAGNTNDIVFKTFNGSALEETARLGGDYSGEGRGVILLSGSAMHVGAMQPRESLDINFFVSGAIGSKGTNNKGTAAFGGDLLVSGALHIGGSEVYQTVSSAAIILDSGGSSKIVWDTEPDGLNPDAQIYENAGDLFLSASDDILIYANDALQVVESSQASGIFASFFAQPSPGVFYNVLDIADSGVIINDDSRSSYDFRVESNNRQGAILVDAGTDTIIFGTNSTQASGEAVSIGVDTRLFMSGTSGSMGTTSRGTSVFAGDVLVSGSTVLGKRQQTGHCLEVSGSARFGTNTSSASGISPPNPVGIIMPTYFSGRWLQGTHGNEPAWMPLGNAALNFSTPINGKEYPVTGYYITAPFDCTLSSMKLSVSGTAGNSTNPASTAIEVYHGFEPNMALLDIAPGSFPGVPPTGFERVTTSVTLGGVTAAGGMTINVPLNVSMSAGERLCIGIDPANGPSSNGAFDFSGALMFEMNQFKEF